MLYKKIEDLTIEDIKNLIENEVPEGRNLEYKGAIPDDSDSSKKEFLADISSFANTDGGDIIYGIQEIEHVIQKEIGIEIKDIDGEIARLENIAREGLSPRIDLNIKALETGDNRKILIIRIKQSLQGPHRVIFKSTDKFYRRNTNGKYSMNIDELRIAFTQSSSILDHIKKFRAERIINIKGGDTPVNLIDYFGFISIHIIPLSSFSSSFILRSDDIASLSKGDSNNLFIPLASNSFSHRINLDGVVAYNGGNFGNTNPSSSYIQLYRDGKIESVELGTLSWHRDSSEEFAIPIGYIEKEILKNIDNGIKLLDKYEIYPPYYIFLSLIGVKNCTVILPNNHLRTHRETISKDNLYLPEIIIENQTDNLLEKLRPIFDMIWNAAGYSKSFNLDENNKFIDN